MALSISDLFTVQRIQGVADAFIDATNAFNANNWNSYADYLDQNVVVYNLSKPGHTVGRTLVIDYFRGISTGNPLDLQFAPTNDINWFPNGYPLAVKGVALWTHVASHHIKVPIHYECQFYPGSFLLTSIWAQHLIGD